MSDQQQDSGRRPPFKWMGIGAALLLVVVLFTVAVLSTGGGETDDGDVVATSTEMDDEPQPGMSAPDENQILKINESLEALAGELLRIDLDLSRLSGDVADIREHQNKDRLSDLRQAVERISASIEDLRVSGAEASEAVSMAIERIGALERQQRKAAQAAAAPPRPRARLLAIDRWGDKPYVVIESTDGRSMSLRPGDTYDGWRLVSAGDGEAVFERSGRTATLSVSGG